MLALDHRTAPIPIYTVRDPALLASSRSQKDTTHVQTQSIVQTPPVSPPTASESLQTRNSLLYPPDGHHELAPNIRALSAADLDLALKTCSKATLPESSTVFPWLHGIHPQNSDQREFFRLPRDTKCSVPTTYRGITIVNAREGSDIDLGRLANSVESRTFLSGEHSRSGSIFMTGDPVWGVGLRNFHIQCAKIATLSDIVIYDPACTGSATKESLALAGRLVAAQKHFREQQLGHLPEYNTFILTDPFGVIETGYPHLVATMNDGTSTGRDPDFIDLEREQMRRFTTAIEVLPNIHLGNTADWTADSTFHDNGDAAPENYHIHIKCLDYISEVPNIQRDIVDSPDPKLVLEINFPGSCSLGNGFVEDEGHLQAIVKFCIWMREQTLPKHLVPNSTELTCADESLNRSDPDSGTAGVVVPTPAEPVPSRPREARKILLTCRDGYTETTFLILCYVIYAECKTLDEAWIFLHCDRRRDFYAFGEDVASIKKLFPVLINASPHSQEKKNETLDRQQAAWLQGPDVHKFSGSLPSRILDHLYLGNLDHADNVAMLKTIGIDRVLSVGEKPHFMFLPAADTRRPVAQLYISAIQDDGIDPLGPQIEDCLKFIADGLAQSQRTLVHCRVGVSRSASICIAEVIRRLQLPIEEAYLLTRARRLNVIIQPNLRFMYELVKWGHEERSKSVVIGDTEDPLLARSIEWPTLAAKISKLNRFYIHH